MYIDINLGTTLVICFAILIIVAFAVAAAGVYCWLRESAKTELALLENRKLRKKNDELVERISRLNRQAIIDTANKYYKENK